MIPFGAEVGRALEGGVGRVARGVGAGIKMARPYIGVSDVDLDMMEEGGKAGTKAFLGKLRFKADEMITPFRQMLGRELDDGTPVSPAGKKFLEMWDRKEYLAQQKSGPHLERLIALNENVVKKHGLNERIASFIEGRAIPETREEILVTESTKNIFDAIGMDALDKGTTVLNDVKYEAIVARLVREGKSLGNARKIAKQQATEEFEMMPQYWPRYYSNWAINKLTSDGKLKEKAIQKVMEMNPGVQAGEAEGILKAALMAPGEFRGGPLQHIRNMDLPLYSEDWYRTTRRYIINSNRRLAEMEVFGNKDQLFNQIVGEMQLEGNGELAELLKRVYKAEVGTGERQYHKLVKPLTAFHAVTMLSTAGVLQPSQLTSVVLSGSTRSLVKALGHVAKNWKSAEQWADAWAGSAMHSIRDDLGPMTDFNDMTSLWSRVIGLEQLDHFNRVVAAHAGRFEAERLFKDLQRNPMSRVARGYLGRYGINVDEALARGELTQEEYRKAGWWMTRKTQFTNRPIDLPAGRSTPFGPLLYLFKSYSIQQIEFIKREMEFAVETGNYSRILKYAAGLTTSASVLAEVLRIVKQRPTPEDPMRRKLEDALMVGSMGLYWDVLRAMASGPEALAMWSLGPTATELYTLLGSDIPAATGVRGEFGPSQSDEEVELEPDFEPMKKHLLRRAPLVGGTLYNMTYGEGR